MAFKTKDKAPKPEMDEDEDEGMDGQDGNQGTAEEEGEPSDEDEAGEEGEEVICTITRHKDGGYCLYEGDEDEGEEGEPDEKGKEGEEGAEPEEGEESHKPQVFNTEGELLKGVLDLLRKDGAEDHTNADHDFESGYNEEKEPMPAPGAAPSREDLY